MLVLLRTGSMANRRLAVLGRVHASARHRSGATNRAETTAVASPVAIQATQLKWRVVPRRVARKLERQALFLEANTERPDNSGQAAQTPSPSGSVRSPVIASRQPPGAQQATAHPLEHADLEIGWKGPTRDARLAQAASARRVEARFKPGVCGHAAAAVKQPKRRHLPISRNGTRCPACNSPRRGRYFVEEGANDADALPHPLNDLARRWGLAAETACFGVWDLNQREDRVHYLPEWKAMLGYGADDGPDPTSIWRERVHPDDPAGILKALT